MAQETFGNRLAEARRRRGLTLEQVHLQLRISPAILESLEAGDFFHMPLKGHARNMVSSYARFLGLDSKVLTEQFLSEYHDFENRESRRASAANNPLGPAAGHYEVVASTAQRPKSPAESQGVRSMWNKPIPTSELNRGYDSRSSSAHRLATAASRRRARTGDAFSGAGGRKRVNEDVRPSLPARISGFFFGHPLVLVIVLIIVLVLALVLWAVAANSCKRDDELILPITGGVNTPSDGSTDGDGASAGEGTGDGVATGEASGAQGEDAAQNDSRYGPFELAIEPAEGSTPWTEVTVDGENVCAETLTERKSWTVSASCTIMTAQPSNLKVTRNGEEVPLAINDENGSGSVELVVQEQPSE